MHDGEIRIFMTTGNIIRAVFGVVLPPAIMLAFTNLAGGYFDAVVTPTGGGTVDDWIQSFTSASMIACLIIAILALIWHLAALLTSGRNGDKRWLWTLLWLGCGIIPTVLFAVWLPAAERGRALAVLIGGFAGLLSFWLGTLWTAPATHKYAPVGRLWIRSAFNI
jgi:hypothetical protein